MPKENQLNTDRNSEVVEATGEQKAHLLAQMDVTMVQKLAFASAHFQLHDGARILDIGCARGKGSYHIAALNPRLQVVGIDYDQSYIDEARETYRLPNLSYIQGDARDLDLGAEKFDAIFNSSVMHEIYSFSDYNPQAPVEAMKSQLEHLKPGGIILLRDFMRAANPEAMVYLDLPPGQSTGTTPEELSDPDLLRLYAQVADTVKPENQRGFFLEHVETLDDGWERFYLSHDYACEFIWRKEYRDRFEPEAMEKYGVWTAKQYRDIPESLGARVNYAAPYRNSWIEKNWLEGKFRLFDEDMKALMGPPSNYIALIQKMRMDQSVKLREHRQAETPPKYLKLEHYKNKETGGLYDLVSRPGNVYDVIPYGKNKQGQIVVYAKSAYPRPLPNIHARQMSPNLDGKSWSGHMVEPLAIANHQGSVADAARHVLEERTAFVPDQIGKVSRGLTYFTAPTDVNEKVSSIFVAVDHGDYEQGLKGHFSNFSEDGSLRAFDMQDLLRGVQVGMLPESRLEMNIYTLMKRLGVTPKDWIGDRYDIDDARIPEVTHFKNLHLKDRKAFQKTKEKANYLKILRSVFVEETKRDGVIDVINTQELEFTVPDHKAGADDISTNSVMVAPVIKDSKTGAILMGVQVRDFPAVQAQEGDNSALITIPGFRLPSKVKDLKQAKEFLSHRFDADKNISALGESYFPSMGILPNRVFPYLVTGGVPDDYPQCQFVPLRELFSNIENLHDAHLILALNRTVHALGLWDDYARDIKPANKAALTLPQ